MNPSDLRRIAILGHGHGAHRFISAAQTFRLPIKTIALYEAVDAHAPFVNDADESLALEPAVAKQANTSDFTMLEKALLTTHATAFWPGWGVGAKMHRIADRCESLGLCFIGPSSQTLRQITDTDTFHQILTSLNIATTRKNTKPPTKRYSILFAGDTHGHIAILASYEHILSSNGQLLLAETPISLPTISILEMGQAAVQIAHALAYTSIGHIEFLCDGDNFYFDRLNPELPAEHGIVEAVTGIDLVQLQFELALGFSLREFTITPRGYAVLAHLLTQKSISDFSQSRCQLEVFDFPKLPHIRIDTSYQRGTKISHDDPSLGYVIAVANDRPHAHRNLHEVLLKTRILLTQGTSNRASLAQAVAPNLSTEKAERTNAWYAATLFWFLQDEQTRITQFIGNAQRGRFVSGSSQHPIEFIFTDAAYSAFVTRTDTNEFMVESESHKQQLQLHVHSEYEVTLISTSARFHLLWHQQGSNLNIETPRSSYSFQRKVEDVIRAPAPGSVSAILHNPGAHVSADDILIVIEAMKTEILLRAQRDGVIHDVLVSPQMHVVAGQPLLRLETKSQPVPKGLLPILSETCAKHPLKSFRELLLGFDYGDISSAPIVHDTTMIPWLEMLDILRDHLILQRGAQLPNDGPTLAGEALITVLVRGGDHEELRALKRLHQILMRCLARYQVTSLARSELRNRALYYLHRALTRLKTHAVQLQLFLSPILNVEVPNHLHRRFRFNLEQIIDLATDTKLKLITPAEKLLADTFKIHRASAASTSSHPQLFELTDAASHSVEYSKKVAQLRQRGMWHPYELIKQLAPMRASKFCPPGKFIEYDLDEVGELKPVYRPEGSNTANIIVGTITNFTDKFADGMMRIILAGDPSCDLGAISEPECRRVIAAIDLAEKLCVPLEWFPVSSGAAISMEKGTETLDWTARVLKRIITFTQQRGEINIIVDQINVGAQSYWNAEATMLMHTRGILIMTPTGSMVLTGKKSLEYSGSVAAADHQGIGGVKEIMGPNGQAQYAATDLADACRILFKYYDYSYIKAPEHTPRRRATHDARTRDIGDSFYTDKSDFNYVRDVFSPALNPERKKPFSMQAIMAALIDQDHPPLERWAPMCEAQAAIVWDAYVGSIPVCMIGIGSKSQPRFGFVPADGPDQLTAATLYPKSSKKVARALNAVSGARPAVVLVNLSGFDGSPESLRELQLEYGAEIGRAVVNFIGPIIFCVLSRYHGGAYVVFSRHLNSSLRSLAVEGAFASVIGGTAAAAVIFRDEVTRRLRNDPRWISLKAQSTSKTASKIDIDQARVEQELMQLKSAEVAEEFDKTHSVNRAVQVGSIEKLIRLADLRSSIIDALETAQQK